MIPGCKGVPRSGTDYCYDPNPNRDVIPPASLQTGSGNAACSGHPACAHLENDCCPTQDDVFLNCCFENVAPAQSPSSTLAPLVATSTHPLMSTSVPTAAPTLAPSLQSAESISPTDLPMNSSTTASPSGSPMTTSFPTTSPASSPTHSPLALLAPTSQPTDLSLGAVETAGNDGDPPSAFPLGRCQADCDDDSECSGDLVCYQRRSSEDVVPGCTGTPDGDSDYCVDPDDVLPELSDVGDNYDPFDAFPLGLCEGDCDGDSGEQLHNRLLGG